MSTSGRAQTAGPDVEALQAACDQLVDAAADPAAARALVVRVWALGAAAADDLLADLCLAAASGAEATGHRWSAAELLDALGRTEAASRLRAAEELGLAVHERAAEEAAQRAARSARAQQAARAVVRIATTMHHRRAA